MKLILTTSISILSEATGNFVFEDRVVELKDHLRNDVNVTINLQDLMPFLVFNAEPEAVRASPIFSDPEVWELCMKIAQSTTDINIYNPATWGDTDYTPVLDVVHTRIADHTSHQQQVEGAIKDISDHSRTGVAVDRRNARMNIHSIFTRPTNIAAKQLFPDVNQIESAAASAHYLDSIKKLNTKIAQAKSHFGIDKCIAFRNRYNDPLVLQSTIQQRQKLDQFSATLPTCNFDVAYKAEKAGQVDLTCAMGGLILISKLMVKSGNLPDIIAELKARGVSKKKYKDKNISALKELLRKSEAQRIIDEEPTKEYKPWDKITTIKPKSDALKALLQTYVNASDNNNENEDPNVP